MGGATRQWRSRRYRRSRRPRDGRRGVVSVVGTLLALLVFFALFGIFLTQYLPLWMTENEAQFTSGVALSFATFKQNVDTQYQFPTGTPPTLATPFQISSQGVPLLAQPTQGTLVFLPSTCPAGFYSPGVPGATAANYGQPVNPAYCVFANDSYSTGPGGSGPYSQRIATGALEMQVPNRYFSPSTFFFEDDAVIETQSGVYQIMSVNPPLNVTEAATGNITVTTTLLQLYGNATTFIGQGSQDVYSHYRYSQVASSNGRFVASNHSFVPFVFTFEIGTQYPCAWSNYITTMMGVSGVAPASYTWTPYGGSCTSVSGTTAVLTLTVSNVNYARLFNSGVQVSAGLGGT